jgi:hypothetical protein
VIASSQYGSHISAIKLDTSNSVLNPLNWLAKAVNQLSLERVQHCFYKVRFSISDFNKNETNKKSELLGFWTFSIIRYSRKYKTRSFGNWICFYPQVWGGKIPTKLCPLNS